MFTCPRCKQPCLTVLLDQDGFPYMCDNCWNDDEIEDVEDLDRCRLGCVCSPEEKEIDN